MKIIYPQYNFRIKKSKEKHLIFDEVRRIWVSLSPEEWVRQNFLQYLIQTKKYPASLISVEKMIMLGELKKRYDIVIYKNNLPWMLVECKQENVPLNIAVIEQALLYNMALPVQYFVVTNGQENLAYKITSNSFTEVADLPEV